MSAREVVNNSSHSRYLHFGGMGVYLKNGGGVSYSTQGKRTHFFLEIKAEDRKGPAFHSMHFIVG